MAQQPVPLASDSHPHHLLSLRVKREAKEITVEDGTINSSVAVEDASPNDGSLLDWKLETCVHGRLNNTGECASLIIFTLQLVAAADNLSWLGLPMTFSISLKRELLQAQDIIEVLRTGQDHSLRAEVSTLHSAVSAD